MRPASVQVAMDELESVKDTLPVAYQQCYAPLLAYIHSLEQGKPSYSGPERRVHVRGSAACKQVPVFNEGQKVE